MKSKQSKPLRKNNNKHSRLKGLKVKTYPKKKNRPSQRLTKTN